ncbi:hypothetical protein [Streptomyces sp. NPDC088719]|uniref:hypothetical protein n=1 Tax=Streptomyces sp. NPDC088719 TaxID=3365872 RepID=UPI0037F72594
MQAWSEGAHVSEELVGKEASLYGRALKAAFQPVLASGAARQYELADATHVSSTTASRYLNGIYVAPKGFVDALATFVSRHGHTLAPGAREELHRLRKNAQAANTTEAKLRRAHERIEELEERLAAAEETGLASQSAVVQEALEGMRVDTARQLAELEEYLGGLNEEIRKELAQEKQLKRAVRDELDQLRLELREKNKLLVDAGDLVRSMNADLERKEEESERKEEELEQLRHEVTVLQGRLARLSEEKAVPGESTRPSGVVAAQAAERTGTASPQGGTARASRSSPPKKPGGRPAQVPDPAPKAPAAPAREDKPRVRLIWPLEPLFATISMLAGIGAPLLILLNCAAFAAACGSKDGPSLTGLVLLAVAGFFFTVIGYVILMVIAGMTDGLTGDHRPLTLKVHRWAWFASLPALALGIHLLATTRVTNTGLWWLHHFGITT